MFNSSCGNYTDREEEIIIDDQQCYYGIYNELYNQLSNPDDIGRVYELVKGLTICFPQRLYTSEYVSSYI